MDSRVQFTSNFSRILLGYRLKLCCNVNCYSITDAIREESCNVELILFMWNSLDDTSGSTMRGRHTNSKLHGAVSHSRTSDLEQNDCVDIWININSSSDLDLLFKNVLFIYFLN